MDTYEKKIREYLNNGEVDELYKNMLLNLFPELKESEDERIRKAIHIYLDWLDGRNKDYQPKGDYSIKDMIAWLEKQGEQKPTDKVEPKFKNGQWIVWQNKYYKVNYNGCGYELIGQNGLSTSLEYVTVDENAHLWTIQDAKDGDVLYSECLRIFWIFKGRSTVYCGCNLNYNDGAFCGEGYIETPTDVIPATKEQRDFLFEKMKESGYEWDAENKELKKIEQKSQRMISAEAKEAMYDKPAWSEKDEQHIDSLLKRLDGLCRNEFERTRFAISEDRDWLTSLKERIE